MHKLTYSVWDVLMADPEKPLPEAKRQHQLTRMYLALSSISGAADAPTETDLALVADAVALIARFLREGEGDFHCMKRPGLVKDVGDAIEELHNAYERMLNIGILRFTGPGIVTVRIVLDTYFELLKIAPERTVIQLHRATEKANIKARNENKAIILKGARN